MTRQSWNIAQGDRRKLGRLGLAQRFSSRESPGLSSEQQVMQAEDACLARHLGDVVGGSVLRAEAWRRQGRAPLIMPGRLEPASGSCFGESNACHMHVLIRRMYVVCTHVLLT